MGKYMLFSSLIDFGAALYVPLVSRRKAAIAFSGLWFCSAIWLLTLYLAATIDDVATLAPIFHSLRFGMFLIAPMLMLFFTFITRIQITKPILFLLITSLTVSVSLYFYNLAEPSEFLRNEVRFHTAPDLTSTIHEINFVAASLYSLGITLFAYRTAAFREKQRLKWLLAAITLGPALGVLSFNYMKLFGVIGNVAALSAMAYALLRHHVIGVGKVVRSTVLKTVSALIFLVCFLLGNQLASTITLSSTEHMVVQLATIFGLLQAYPWLYKSLETLAQKHFDKDAYDIDATKIWTLKALKNCGTVAGLSRICDRILIGLVRVDRYELHCFEQKDDRTNEDGSPTLFVAIDSGHNIQKEVPASPLSGSALLSALKTKDTVLFYDEVGPQLKADFLALNASACVPVTNNGNFVGVLVLGRPLKAVQYSFDDTQLLSWLGKEIGPMIESVFNFSRLEKGLTEAEKKLSLMSHLNTYNHDLKTPFSNIEALLKAGDVFTEEEKRDRILKQVQRGHRLVSTMTDLLRGTHQRHMADYNLNDVIEHVRLCFPAQSHMIHPAYGDLPDSYGFKDEIGILFFNLISNAIQAQDKPDHRIEITTWYAADLDQLRCQIRDTGRGIPANKLETLWQEGASSHREDGGTGVGLGIIKRIITDHNGSITVQSNVGEGTIFSFSLPRISAQALSSQAHRDGASLGRNSDQGTVSVPSYQ